MVHWPVVRVLLLHLPLLHPGPEEEQQDQPGRRLGHPTAGLHCSGAAALRAAE